MRSPNPSLALEVDFVRRAVRVDGQPVDLTAVEFDILASLAREPGSLVTRGAMLDLVWGTGFAEEEQLVELTMADLRAKLDDGHRPSLIETVGVIGYRLAPLD